jgi:hypothetical protein
MHAVVELWRRSDALWSTAMVRRDAPRCSESDDADNGVDCVLEHG